MRHTTLLASLLLIGIGCSKPASHTLVTDTAKTAQAAPVTDIQTVMIDVPTAKCEQCEGTIAKAAKTVDGVTDVKVDAEKHTAQVQFIAARANKSQIEHAISEAGYTADHVVRNGAAYNKLEDCCK